MGKNIKKDYKNSFLVEKMKCAICEKNEVEFIHKIIFNDSEALICEKCYKTLKKLKEGGYA